MQYEMKNDQVAVFDNTDGNIVMCDECGQPKAFLMEIRDEWNEYKPMFLCLDCIKDAFEKASRGAEHA